MILNCQAYMKIPQIPFIYTNPTEISSKQELLEQIVEFSEIGFNEKLKKRIESNKAKIQLYMTFDTSEYSKSYLAFLNSMIRVLSLEEKDIDTVPIRGKRADHNFKSKQPATKNDYKLIEEIPADSTLRLNVIKRLGAFREKLESIRNQQLLLQAKSLVKSATDELVENQQNLESIQNRYLELLKKSDYSQALFEEFDRNFNNWFGGQYISKFEQSFAEKKRIMGEIMKQCEASSVTAEEIRKEQSELVKQRENFESIKKQAEDLMSLTTQFKQIKTIEAEVAKKAEELLVSSDAPKLQELIKFIAAKEEEIKLIKQKIDGTSEIHTKTRQAIGEIEQSIQEKKKQAESLQRELEDARNQELVLQAKSLVKSATDDLVANQKNLELMQNHYRTLLNSNQSPKSFEEFDRNFNPLFSNVLSFEEERFNDKNLIMDGVLEGGKETSVEKKIRGEQSKLNELKVNFKSIMEQAKDLRSLRTMLEEIKTLENEVTQKAIPSDDHGLREFIRFVEEQKSKLHKYKKEIHGTSDMHKQTVQAIDRLEEAFQQKKEKVEIGLQQIKTKSSEAQPKIESSSGKDSSDEESQDASSNLGGEAQKNDGANLLGQGSHKEKEKRNEEAALTEEKKKRLKNRLEEAISLIQTYKKTLEAEEKTCSFLFFYKSRNHAKSDYCISLESKLKFEITTIDQIKTIDDLCSIHDIINKAHNSVIATKNNVAKMEITKGGSYFGTSRMLSLQRLLDIDEAWKNGRSKFFGDDFHGLKTSGVVGEKAQKAIKEFYLAIDDNDVEFQDLKNRTFPTEVTTNKRLNELK
ncbi:hypothetical protein DGG96_07700 [Legionella qingyii]|nr:hypothetical protein DGG96_07700 [Legionella qingyii]